MLQRIKSSGWNKARILVAVTNYGFAGEASYLKTIFEPHFDTVLINCDSNDIPVNTDFNIENSFYPGLLSFARKLALEGEYEWLFFVASDITFHNFKYLPMFLKQVASSKSIGVYSPSLTADSRTAFNLLFNRETSNLRKVGVVEGFIFAARTELVPEPNLFCSSNKYGWGLDILMSYKAFQSDYLVVVDDRVKVTHPNKKQIHAIDELQAFQDSNTMLGEEILSWLTDTQQALQVARSEVDKLKSLDLGCGPHVNNYFSTEECVGIDLFWHKNSQVIKRDLTRQKIPFDDNYFDYITAFDFIEHVPRLSYRFGKSQFPFIQLMNEIYRTLKPGGIFLSLTPAFPDGKAFQDPTHVNFITERTWSDYFCGPNLWARMYKFEGEFSLESQIWEDGKLKSILRKE